MIFPQNNKENWGNYLYIKEIKGTLKRFTDAEDAKSWAQKSIAYYIEVSTMTGQNMHYFLTN